MKRLILKRTRVAQKRAPRVKSTAGFTMVELLVVMLIGSILSAAVVAVFIQQTRAMALNEDLVNLEQNLRSGMDLLQRDVRTSGSYSKAVYPPFVIGGIDSDGDGAIDKSSDGGAGPDALQIQYSENAGLKIATLAGTEFRVCSPSGLVVNQIIPLSNSDGSATIEFPVKTITNVACGAPCLAGCDKINYDPPVLNGSYDGGVLWNELKAVTYFIEPNYIQDGVSLGPALMQKRGLTPAPPPYVVAFGINDLQVVYRDLAGTATTTLADIRRVEITLTGETRDEHSIVGSGKRSRSMTTEVQVRNLYY